MSYNYSDCRNILFTEKGSVAFMEIRDKANELLNIAGAVRSGEIIELTSSEWAGQNRVFIKNPLSAPNREINLERYRINEQEKTKREEFKKMNQ